MNPLNRPRRAALLVAAAYLAVAIVWILSSDWLVTVLVPGAEAITWVQTIKGLFFVTGSALLIFVLVLYQLRRQGMAERELELSEGRLRQVLDAVNDGVWDVDLADRSRINWNRRWFEIVGHEPGDLVSMDDWRSIIHPDDLADVNRTLAAHIAGKTPFYVHELRVRRKDGTWAWVLSRGRVVGWEAGGTPRHMVGTYTDITALKEQQARLSRAVEELTRSRVQIARFAYAAAHDLKEPVRLVGSYATLLRRRLGEHVDGPVAEDLSFLHDAALRIDGMVEGVLRSLEQAPARPFQTVVLGEVLGGVRSRLAPDLIEAGATLAVAELPTVGGDPVQLGLVFEHLVGNALKFRRPEVPPRLTVAATRLGETWRITVTDNGIGFPVEKSESIFLAFTRLHAPAAYPGAGMGLSICRAIIDSHGGSITARPRDDGPGSQFIIVLPVLDDPLP